MHRKATLDKAKEHSTTRSDISKHSPFFTVTFLGNSAIRRFALSRVQRRFALSRCLFALSCVDP
jgi:hypothetical protein